MKELVSVIIPIPDPNLNPTQERLLRHCLDALVRYPVIFITYEGADMSIVKEHKEDADIICFSKEYFQSRQTMARLFLMEDFYERFSWADFLLIHELNSWIVKDELHYWCKQGYDYLKAAPVARKNETLPNQLALFLGLKENQKTIMGNGFEENGLFLCHVQRMIKALRKKEKTAYQYRHNKTLENRDAVFWETEANRLWPTLRKPSTIVRDFFCKSLSGNKLHPDGKSKQLPFAFTGINNTNIDDLPYQEVRRKK
ncbi:DUF5672 family protein [Dyadobacter sp. CY312]|uniref:DUF5672 family protein n=1 Tax=Dyadobacter sp. CY312 TaxID=2907303 RepID=UPI001F2DE152|nr:DUF5672 family protein [Dyadobacter sp. CY312]MCE7040072.1 hypothetical protein [Dyadobacter sp. CY312]